MCVWKVCVGGVCVCVAARRCLWKSLRTYSHLICLSSFFLFCLRLPEPRANPMDPRNLEDNDFGPSMDHAPWYQQKKLFRHPPVLQCLLQPAISPVELSGCPPLCQPSPFYPSPPPLRSHCLLAVNWPWRRLLWQIWMAMSFLLPNCFNSSLATNFL